MPQNHPLTPQQTVALTREIELLLEYGISLSQQHSGTEATFLAQQTSIVFAKCLMSLIGFLRFVPPSKYRAKESVEVVDLSSASVMARQFIEDAVVFFYLSERGLSDAELRLRQTIWLFHGAVEAGEAAKLADPNGHVVILSAAALAMRESIEKHPLFESLGKDQKGREAQGRIKKGRQPLLLSHQDIIRRRGISVRAYLFPLKVFSNFVHSSSISVRFIDETGWEWESCYHQFIQVLYHVAAYATEVLVCFQEGTKEAGALPPKILELCTEYRKLLRED